MSYCNCVICDNTGWRPSTWTQTHGQFVGTAYACVTRCHCKKVSVPEEMNVPVRSKKSVRAIRDYVSGYDGDA